VCRMNGLFQTLYKQTEWKWINMQEARELVRFCRTNAWIQAIQDVCYKPLISGLITMEFGSEKQCNGERLKIPSGEEHAKARALSLVVGQWGSDLCRLDDEIGFAPSCGVATNERDALLRLRPTVMNIDMLEIYHKLDVYGIHHWRVFTYDDNMRDGEFPGLRELHDVLIIGSNLPDSNGTIYSTIKNLRNECDLLEYKKHYSKIAIAKRANPIHITQSLPESHDANDLRANATYDRTTLLEQVDANAEDHTAQARNVFANVNAANCGTVDALFTRSGTAPKKHATSILQAKLDIGQTLATTQMPEAPIELYTSMQAFIEIACNAFGIPMSIISSGDATSKSKMNGNSASTETGELFNISQSHRKTRLEAHIQMMYRHMYSKEHVRQYIVKVLDARAKKLLETRKKSRGKKRKADPDAITELDDDLLTVDDVAGSDLEDDESDISFKAMEEAAQVRVSIPSSQHSDRVAELAREGVISYSFWCKYEAQKMCIPLDSFYTTQKIPEDPDAAAKPKKKPKAK